MNELTIPPTYNVYGYIFCDGKIMLAKDVIIRAFNLNEKNMTFDNGVLCINASFLEIEVTKKDLKKWSIKAAIAGNNEMVFELIKALSEQLNRQNIQSTFEIYDDDFNCIADI